VGGEHEKKVQAWAVFRKTNEGGEIMKTRVIALALGIFILGCALPLPGSHIPVAHAQCGGSAADYDTNRDRLISRVEAIAAVNDYLVYECIEATLVHDVIEAWANFAAVTGTSKVTRVILENLTCVQTEDVTGDDECRLELFVDGALQKTMRYDLNDGEKWELSQSYYFEDQVLVKLYDEDPLDPDDWLGDVLIDTSPVSHATATFTEDEAYYQLEFSVVEEVISTGGQPEEPTARRVLLDKLICKTTEDDTGDDECRVEIFVDGVLTTTLTRDLNEGEQWQLNESHVFASRVKVRLYDDDLGDWRDPDDWLGDVFIDTSPVGHATATFTEDEAEYELLYRVLAESAPVPQPMVTTTTEVLLQALVCNEPEDYWGDECRLEIFVDGFLANILTGDLDEGEEWQLNESHVFESQVRVRLYDEEDWPAADNFLGEVVIRPDPTAHAMGYFTQDEADYELTYSVVEYSLDPVQVALDAFRNSPRPGVWRHIEKADLVRDMEDKINNPSRVDQLDQPVCGPTAIVYELVSRQPARYVQICQELYETGSFHALTEDIWASEDLLNSEPHLSLADWMLIGTLRDHANLYFGIDSEVSGIEGLSTPWEMEEWTRLILGYHPEYTSTYLYGELDALREGEGALARGGVAFLMIDGDLVKWDWVIEHCQSYCPKHWVSLLGNVGIEGGVVQFSVYTWGSERDLAKDVDDFENCMWGVVTGVPY
jgi:hypothetical protein